MAWYRRSTHTETRINVRYICEKKTEIGHERLIVSYESLKETDTLAVSPPGIVHWVRHLLRRCWWRLIILAGHVQNLQDWLCLGLFAS